MFFSGNNSRAKIERSESFLQRFVIAATAFVSFALQVFPLHLYFFVFLEFGIGFAISESHFNVCGYEVGKEQCIDALALVFRFYTHKQEVENIGMFHEECFQEMKPPERKQYSMRLLQRTYYGGHGNSKRHKIA